MTLFQSVILGVVEGLTEFLPVSSTGHMILAKAAMGLQDDSFADTFLIVIQLGAILAVMTAYYKRFLVSLNIYLKLGVAVVPTLIAGKLIYKTLKAHLLYPIPVCIALVVGGILLIMLDKWSSNKESKYEKLEDISFMDAIKIGLFQCISLIPGVSRAAATIFGGIFAGFNRGQATEFSFLLAVPTMMAATGYDLYKTDAYIGQEQWMMIFAGGAVAFFVAWFAIKTFIALITRFGFKYFGIYRILVGLIFLILAFTMEIKMN